MISKEAIKQYLDRELDEWLWFKKLKVEDLKEEILHYFPKYTYRKYPAYKHQLVMLLLGIINPQFLFFADMGGGKTRTILDLFWYWKQKGKVKKGLVICPATVVSTWGEQIEEHSDLSYRELTGTVNERVNQLEQDADLYIINYQGLLALLTNIRKGKKKGKRVPDFDKIKVFSSIFDFVVYDEIHFCKSPDSLTFRLCQDLSLRSNYRYGLTGTPFGRDPMDFWSQFFLIDLGETFTQNINFFRNVFFDFKLNYWGAPEWSFKKDKKISFRRFIQHKSIRYNENEMNDLPPKTIQRIPIKLTKEVAEYYKKAYSDFLKAKTNVDHKNIMKRQNNFIRARMLCSGFLDFTDEDGIRQSITFKDNPKLDALMELIETTPKNAKIVVVKEFIRSGDIIGERLDKAGIKYTRLDSTTKDKKEALHLFKTDDRYKIFIMNSQSGAFGLNLQAAKYQVFYESPTSPIVRKQAEKRVHRTGQTKHVFIYDLYIKDKVEEKILQYLQEGKDLFQSLLEWKEEK